MQRLRASWGHVTCRKVNGNHQIELSASSKIVYKRVFLSGFIHLLNSKNHLSCDCRPLSVFNVNYYRSFAHDFSKSGLTTSNIITGLAIQDFCE